uniref:Ig-like domain-containing protein n=1 Tax=Maylandia zebra TaxID=106582 RepID=A0A3P9C5L5_9CICH
MFFFFSFPSSQSVRTDFIGGEVLLPCVYSEKLSEPVTAFWRDKDDKVVLDIIESKEHKIDPKFKGRVVSFPDQYKTGNLSILIKGLRADNAGPYNCNIPKVDYQTKMTLKVTGHTNNIWLLRSVKVENVGEKKLSLFCFYSFFSVFNNESFTFTSFIVLLANSSKIQLELFFKTHVRMI